MEFNWLDLIKLLAALMAGGLIGAAAKRLRSDTPRGILKNGL